MQNIIVVYGGDSVESDVSVITATLVLNSMDMNRYNVYPIYIRDGKLWLVDRAVAGEVSTYLYGITKDMREAYLSCGALYRRGKWRSVKVADIDCALLATHGGSGENGALQGMLEINGVPYTSSGVLTAAMCMDKDFTHRATESLGIGTVQYYTVTADMSARYIEELFDKLGGRVVVKPNSLGSSIGIRLVTDIRGLHSALGTAFRYDSKVLLERCVDNMIELNCAVILTRQGVKVSRVDVVGGRDDIYGFDEKYISGRVEQNISLPDDVVTRVCSWSAMVYQRLDMSGVVRIDYMYDSNRDELYLNEVNTIPGSLAYYLFDTDGMDMTDITTELIETAIERTKKQDNLVRRFSSSILTLRENSSSKLLQKIRK